MGLILAAALVVSSMGVASAEERARGANSNAPAAQATDAYKTATRLGGSRAFVGPVNSAAALKRTAANKPFQKNVSTVMDSVGLTALTSQVLSTMAAADPSVVKDTTFPIGGTMEWMALKTNGKPDTVKKIKWGGKAPFPAFAFSLEDGVNTYNFVIPKACGNIALASVTQKPLPDCVTIDVQKDCDKKTMSVRASGASISGDQIARVEVTRGGSKVVDLMPGQKFAYSGPMASGRYSFKAYDKYGRQVPICQNRGEIVVEDCPAPPPPPPPPAAASCKGTATAVKVKGGYDVTLDASGSGTGASPAKTAAIEIIGPAGTAVPFMVQGKPQTSITMTTPFTTTVFLPKPVNGTYTVRAKVEAENPKAAGSSCETTFVIGEVAAAEALPRWFADGTFGKQRRQYELEPAIGTGTIEPGFCDPLLGVKFGPMLWFNNGRASFAPAAGMAFMFGDLGDYDYGDNEYNNVSFHLDATVNYHFSPGGGFIGTGLSWWDVFDGDHNTAAWLVNFGIPMGSTGRVQFIGEGRYFFEGDDGLESNYLLWGGVRYLFGAR